MSQPALTSFFSQTKRATRSRAPKVLDAPSEVPPPTKRSTRAKNTKKDVEITQESPAPAIVKPKESLKVDEEANVLKEIKPSDVNKKNEAENNDNVAEKTSRTVKVGQKANDSKNRKSDEIEKSEKKNIEEDMPKPKRVRKKVVKETNEQ